MKQLMQIGNDVVKDEVRIEAAGDAIVKVIKAGAEAHVEQETIRAGIHAIGELSPVKNVTVTGSTFTNNPAAIATPTINEEDEEDYGGE